MRRILMFCLLSSASLSNAGFVTAEERESAKKVERLENTKKYVDGVLGKVYWYNSDECVTDKIYQHKDKTSYSDPSYSTNNEYVPIKFIEADINQDIYSDEIIYKVEINSKDGGYVRESTNTLIKIGSDRYSSRCFLAKKPEQKEKNSNVDISRKYLLDWNVNCRKDKFDHQKICSISKYSSDVMVNLINGKYSVYVGGNHYPNSQSAIKIDNHAAVYGHEGISQTPLKVIEQMKKGKVAYTRYREWPYDYNLDGEVDLNGFAEKFAEMLVEYGRL